jgi:hypothetical protein
MGVTTRNYGVSVSFSQKLAIFYKTVGKPMDFKRKFENFENP